MLEATKLIVQVPTYNRRETIGVFVESLRRSSIPNWVRFRFVDDSSTEFTLDELQAAIPLHAEFYRNETNLGSDANIRQLILYGSSCPVPYTLLLDSDLLVSPNIWSVIESLIACNVPIITLYNSCKHESIAEKQLDGLQLVSKRTVGSAGCLIRRDIALAIINNVPPSRTYDWDWSHFLISEGIQLLATSNSYLQHIGIRGTNSIPHEFDFAVRFRAGNEFNVDKQTEMFQSVIEGKERALERCRNLVSHRIGRMVCYPLFKVAQKFGYESRG